MTNNTNEYVTIGQAAETATEPGQFWELHPDQTIDGNQYDERGFTFGMVELTSDAAITDLEAITDGSYRLWGNQYGESFRSLEANIDGDTLVRLVDER